LKLCREPDPNSTPKGIAVSDADMAGRNIQRADFHGAWSYAITQSNQVI
jgi:hypothetical protein